MKRNFFYGMVAIAVAAALTASAQAQQLAPYSQDFEGLAQADAAALATDGWVVFGNVFTTDGFYVYGYGTFPAPNGGPGFCAIDAGQGGAEQGAQQLSIYSDYNNGDQWWGVIEANTFQEQRVGAADIGKTWIFEFDAKRGNINNPDDPNCPFDANPDRGSVPCESTAIAFIKTLDPNNGFFTTNFITIDTTDLPDTWGRFAIPITIDAGLVGQILQFGFSNNATLWQPSGVLYDNINFDLEACEPDAAGQGYWHRQCLGVPAGEGGIDPGRSGRGPSAPTEPLFVEELMPCANARLASLGLYGTTTCRGMDADPANDTCEKAEKQLTALILNACSGRVQNTCDVDLSTQGCLATDLDGLLIELAGYIEAGSCQQTIDCASAVNEGFGLAGGGESTVEERSVATPQRNVDRNRRGKLAR